MRTLLDSLLAMILIHTRIPETNLLTCRHVFLYTLNHLGGESPSYFFKPSSRCTIWVLGREQTVCSALHMFFGARSASTSRLKDFRKFESEMDKIQQI